MSLYPRLFLVTALATGLAGQAVAETVSAPKPHQIVIISFDGAHDLAQWKRSRALAKATGAHFTYFLSCVFLLSPATRKAYQAPTKNPGRSNVGFAQSRAEVAGRLSQIWAAWLEGHDIASHACGHYDGSKWSEAQWKAELGSFTTILRDAFAINGIAGEPTGWRKFAETAIAGFRVPYLATGKHLDDALAEAGYRYSASGISRGPVEPNSAKGLVQFSLPLIPEGPSARKVIAMDYNLFVRHSGGFERSDADGAFEARSLAAFRAAFDAQYQGERIPLQLGFHFTLMNGGAYWRALERFAGDVCLRADVDCISYADYLERHKPTDPAKVGAVDG